jgi:GntR family transcriptional regulator/MocR family aminotransferase
MLLISKTDKYEPTNLMKQTPWLAFSIERSSSIPIFEQICLYIRNQATAGDLPAGTRLPPTRVFATELGVSRSTVVTAYEQLAAEGYIESLQGSGHTVCRMGDVELGTTSRPKRRNVPEEPAVPTVPFQVSEPDMRLFPHLQWAKAVSRVCRTDPAAMLTGGSSFGNQELRQAVAQHVAKWRGIEASPHQIIITAGSGDALEICIRALTSIGDAICLEDPGYPPLRAFATAMGLSPVFMTIDQGGAILPTDSNTARLVVLTPSHQYPLGGAMSPSRRLEFIRWAGVRDAWIIEDDYDSEYRYAGRPIPAMAGFDKLRRTIYVGSFSKIFSNRLRLGYLIVPDDLLERFRATLARFGVKASYMPQQALAEFIDGGEFYRHLRRMRRVYGERRKFMLDHLAAEFSGFGTFQDHQAGMQVVLHLNENLHDVELAARAAKNGLIIQALSAFSSVKTTLNGLVLGYCAFSEEELAPALDTLGTILVR